jgi:transketolase
MKLALEAGVTLGWERWTGTPAHVHGLDRFGASAPYETIFEELGFTAEAVVDRVKILLEE